MWQKGKKGERDRHELCERAGSCAQHHPGQGSNPHCASPTKLFHCHPGMARKAGHVSHSVSMELGSGRDSTCAPWTVKLRLIPLIVLCHPELPPRHCPLPSPWRYQCFPAPQSTRAGMPGEPSRSAEGGSAPGAGHPPCVKPHPKCWCEP